MVGKVRHKLRRGKRGGRRSKNVDGSNRECNDYGHGVHGSPDGHGHVNRLQEDQNDPIVNGHRPLTGSNSIELHHQGEADAKWIDRGVGSSVNLKFADRRYLLSIEDELERLIDTVRSDRSQDPSIKLLCQNVVTQIEDRILTAVTDPDVSRVIEKIIWAGDIRNALKLLQTLGRNWLNLSADQFASYVCQTLLCAIHCKLNDADDKLSDDEQVELCRMIGAICDEFSGKIANVLVNKYASHVVHALLCILSLNEAPGNLDCIRSERSKGFNTRKGLDRYKSIFTAGVENTTNKVQHLEVASRFSTLIGEFSKKILQGTRDKVGIFIRDASATHIFQRLLDVESMRDELMSEVIGMSNISADEATTAENISGLKFNENFHSLIFHQAGSRFAEKLLAVASGGLFYLIYQNFFRNRLDQFVSDPVANFVVQRLLKCLKNSVQASVVIKELLPLTPKLIEHNKSGVLVQMFEVSKLYKVMQRELSQKFFSSFEHERPDIVFQMLSLSTQQDYALHIRRFNTQASLILQSWLDFDKRESRTLISAVLNLSPEDTLHIIRSAIGSHFIEKFFLCVSLPTKARCKKILSLSTHYIDLVLDKYGSRVFEKLWLASDLSLKKVIARELLLKQDQLLENQYGRIIFRKLKIDTLIRGAEEWSDKQSSAVSKRKGVDAVIKETLRNNKQNLRSSELSEIRKIDPLWAKNLFRRDLFKWDADDEKRLSCIISSSACKSKPDINVGKVDSSNARPLKKFKTDLGRKAHCKTVNENSHIGDTNLKIIKADA